MLRFSRVDKLRFCICWFDNHAQMTVRDALNSALDEEMSADPKVFLMGEEVRITSIFWMEFFFPLVSCFNVFSSHVFYVCVKCRLVSIRVHIRSDFLVNDIDLKFFMFFDIPFSYILFFPLKSLTVHSLWMFHFP